MKPCAAFAVLGLLVVATAAGYALRVARLVWLGEVHAASSALDPGPTRDPASELPSRDLLAGGLLALIVLLWISVRRRIALVRAYDLALRAERARNAALVEALAEARARPASRTNPPDHPNRSDGTDWRSRWAAAVLGARGGESEAELKRLRSRALIRAHPDSGGDARSLEEVEEAWSVLTGARRSRSGR